MSSRSSPPPRSDPSPLQPRSTGGATATGALPGDVRHALELLLRDPDPVHAAALAGVREAFCRAAGALRDSGVPLAQVILLIEDAARDAGATPEVILEVVGLCADEFIRRRSSER